MVLSKFLFTNLFSMVALKLLLAGSTFNNCLNIHRNLHYLWGRHHDRMVVGFITVQSVPITTKVVSSNLAYGEMYSIQHCVIKFVSNLRQVGGVLRVRWFPQPIKVITTI